MRSKSKLIQFCIISGLLIGLILPNFALLTRENANSPQPSLIPLEIPEDLQARDFTKPEQLPNAGFIENKGQLGNDECQFYLSVGELTVYFGLSKINFVKASQQEGTEELSITTNTVEFPGGALVEPVGIDANAHAINYITGAGAWTDVPSFNAIVYSAIYPGIDLKYFLTDEGLKYEFLVNAGADPNQIVIAIEGVGSFFVLPTEITSDGLYQDYGLIAYQTDGSLVDANFVPAPFSSTSYAFNLGSYDSTQDLVIDPLVIDFSTYLGGSLDEGRGGSVGNENGIYIDTLGYIYITGITLSNNFPTLNNLSGYVGNWDIFVTKLLPNASALVYSTYVGGSNNEHIGAGIQVDNQGNAYVLGATYSNNFPTVNYYQTDPDGTSFLDIIIFKLNATGNGLNYSTYIGGTAQESGQGLAIDADGNAYITGYSTSSNYPLKNQYQGYDGSCSVILTKLNATGDGLVYSTYFGGSTPAEYSEAIDVDTYGNVYIAGQMAIYSTPSNFPLKNAWDSSAPTNYLEGFISCFNATGNGLNFSTYIGGSFNDALVDIKLGNDGCVYAVGQTDSSGTFPTINAYQASFGGGSHDAILVKLNATGNGAIFSTYLGGNGQDLATDLSLNPTNEIVVVGLTASTNFVTVAAFQSGFQGGTQDVFVTMLTTNGTSVIFSSYLGGGSWDFPIDVWIDANNSTFIFGETDSTNFPTRHLYQGDQGGRDDFITKMLLDESPIISPAGDFSYQEYNSGNQINWTITDPVINNGNYSVFKNGSGWGSFVNQFWTSGVELHVNVDGLTKGVYNFTILADDGYGLTTTDEVIVNVTGDAPEITGSNDFSYYADSTGQQINWTIVDDSVGPLANYSVFKNGSVWGTYENLFWVSGVELQVSVDGLTVGLHNFTIRAFDGTGSNATDEVLVMVLKRTTNGTWQDINLGNQFITCFEMEVTFAEVFIKGVATGSHIKITAYVLNPTDIAITNGVRFFTIELDIPSAVSFPVTTQLHYDESQLPAGVKEEKLGVYHLVNGQWLLQAGTINTDLNTITIVSTSFSDFAIAPVPDTNPPFDPAMLTWMIAIAVAALVAYGCIKFRKGKGKAEPEGFPELEFDL